MEGWLPGLVAIVVVVVVLVVLDRLTAAGVFDRDHDRPRERRPGGGGAGGALGSFLGFFDPSYHHLAEEQQREKSTTLHMSGEAPPLIDLDSGVAELPGHAPHDDPGGRTARSLTARSPDED